MNTLEYLNILESHLEGTYEFVDLNDKIIKFSNLEIIQNIQKINKGSSLNLTIEIGYILCWAAENNLHKLFKCLCTTANANVHFKNSYAVRWAASKGYLKIVTLCQKYGVNICAENNHAIQTAAFNGHYHMVQHLHTNGADIFANDSYVLRWAAIRGHFDIVKYVCTIIFNSDDTASSEEVKNNLKGSERQNDKKNVQNLSTTKSRSEQFLTINLPKILLLAGEHGHINIVEYLWHHRVKILPEIMRSVIYKLNLPMLKFLLSKSTKIDFDLINIGIRLASTRGHLSTLKFLFENITTDSIIDFNYCLKQAIINHHIDTAIFLYINTNADDLTKYILVAQSYDNYLLENRFKPCCMHVFDILRSYKKSCK